MNSKSRPKVLFTRQEIDAAIGRLASEVTRDYHAQRPILVGVLKGSFVFMADLMRLLDFPLEIVVDKLEKLEQMAKDLGTTLTSPFAILSFLALPVIPELRLTDLGLVDVNEFRIIS